MSKIRVIADLHKGHVNMAKKRGFDTVEEHDEYMIKQWNKVVSKRDTVFILGDLTMEKSDYEFLTRLNGIKKVISGNHDMPQHSKELLKYVNGVTGAMKLKGCILTHIPIHSSELDRFYVNIHGHIHEKKIWDTRYYCVSAEHLDFKPVEIDKIVEWVKLRRSSWFDRLINKIVVKLLY
jgi:calcineurin-like phosphoesterase family protein